MAGVVNTTSATIPLHHRGLLEIWDLFQANKPNLWRDIVGKEISSDELFEEIASFSGLGIATDIREAGGVPFDQWSVPYTKQYFHQKFAIGVEFSHEVSHKDAYGKLKAPGKLMAQSHYWAHEQAAADVLNFAFDTGYLGYDGQPLADTAHNPEGSSFSNISSAAALSVSALETMLTDLMLQVSFRGQPMINTGPWDLIVPPQLYLTAKQILQTTEGRPGTSDHSHNVTPGMINLKMGNPYLTDTNGFVLLPSGEDNPIRQMNGMPMRVKEDYDIRHDTHLFAMLVERTFFWKPPFGTMFNAGA